MIFFLNLSILLYIYISGYLQEFNIESGNFYKNKNSKIGNLKTQKKTPFFQFEKNKNTGFLAGVVFRDFFFFNFVISKIWCNFREN
jgi:hypothetical protein